MVDRNNIYNKNKKNTYSYIKPIFALNSFPTRLKNIYEIC